MGEEKNLRSQVRAELKWRRYVAYTLLLLCILYVSANLVFGDMGLIRYFELREKTTSLEKELTGLRLENERIRESINSYKDKDFYAEKNARENFGLAGKDEYIFLYEGGQKGSGPQAP